MKTLFRVLGTAAAVAVTGAAIVVLDKILNEKDALHVEQVEFPEEAEKDAAEAEKVAEAYAEGEAKSAEPGDAWPPAFEKTPEAAAPAKEETKAEEPVAEEAPEAAPEEAPVEPAAKPGPGDHGGGCRRGRQQHPVFPDTEKDPCAEGNEG